jgi:hypothetical protein
MNLETSNCQLFMPSHANQEIIEELSGQVAPFPTFFEGKYEFLLLKWG